MRLRVSLCVCVCVGGGGVGAIKQGGGGASAPNAPPMGTPLKEASSFLSREEKMALIKEAGIVNIGPGEVCSLRLLFL